MATNVKVDNWRRFAIKIADLIFIHVYSVGARALRRYHPEWHNRRWSNAELRRWGRLFTGDVINVSGWDDRDKEGGCYSDYFPNKASYTISNISGARGATGAKNEIYLDLLEELPQDLIRKFDVVFNHTTLEHIYNIRKAVANLRSLSRDIVVIIVPFLQPVHWEPGSFLDYWRPTPFALREMFRENGLEVVYWANNDNPVYPVYLFCVATRRPKKWRRFFPRIATPTMDDAPGHCWYNHRLPSSRGDCD